jgi:hypothetical protein
VPLPASEPPAPGITADPAAAAAPGVAPVPTIDAVHALAPAADRVSSASRAMNPLIRIEISDSVPPQTNPSLDGG